MIGAESQAPGACTREVRHACIASELRQHRILVRAGNVPSFHGVGLGSNQSWVRRTGLWGDELWTGLRLHPWGRAGVQGLRLWPWRRDGLGRTHLTGEKRRDMLAL